MHAKDTMTKEEFEKLEFSDSHFDLDYFETGKHHGFSVPYSWENMRSHVVKKLDLIERIYRPLNVNTMLFCGCAKGFEVKEARNRGYSAYGLDISKYAISSVEIELRPFCKMGDVSAMPEYPDNKFDLVNCFDVLHILEPERRKKAFAELNRIARKGIALRLTTAWRGGVLGFYEDGNPLILWSNERVIDELEQYGKMEFIFSMLSNRFEISWFFFAKQDSGIEMQDYYV